MHGDAVVERVAFPVAIALLGFPAKFVEQGGRLVSQEEEAALMHIAVFLLKEVVEPTFVLVNGVACAGDVAIHLIASLYQAVHQFAHGLNLSVGLHLLARCKAKGDEPYIYNNVDAFHSVCLIGYWLLYIPGRRRQAFRPFPLSLAGVRAGLPKKILPNPPLKGGSLETVLRRSPSL